MVSDDSGLSSQPQGWLRTIHEIESVIREICELHKSFSEEWLENESNSLNLKKKEIYHICEVYSKDQMFILDNDFYSYYNDYLFELQNLTAESDLEIDYSHLDLSTRVKQNESVMNKIRYYRLGKEEKGKSPIKKCLNDLFGIRIQVPGFIHEGKSFYEMCADLKSTHPFRVLNASKKEYKATHLYFQNGNNRFFPWELQIWNSDDEIQNKQSHHEHKQEYTSWAKIYKESRERRM